jgi:hypothetical protein
MKPGENIPTVLDTLKIERPAFSQDNLNTTFSYEKPEKDIKISKLILFVIKFI